MHMFGIQHRLTKTIIGLCLFLVFAGLATAQTTVVLRGTPGGMDQGRVNFDPDDGLKVRTPADSNFISDIWQTGSVSSGDFFGDAGDGRLVLEFDLSSIPPGRFITSATLHVFLPTDAPAFLVRFFNGSFDLDAHHLTATNDGVVTVDDYNGASTDLGIIIPSGVDPFAIPPDPSEYTLDVTTAVSTDHSASRPYVSFRLQSDPTFNDKSDRYLGVVTETYANPAFRPFLEVTYSGSPPPPVRVSDLVGSNGFPGKVGFFQHDTTALWQEMGLPFYRHDVLWGEVEMTQDVFDFSPSHPDALDHDLIISTAAANGFEPLVILAYTAPWAASIPDPVPRFFRRQFQNYSPPTDPADWVDYVTETVSRYTSPPFNVKYFEVWNEPFAEFWLGTKEEYVDQILIPAAQVIRDHGAKVVAPAWAGAGPAVLNDWLNYNNAWTHIDILSVHFNWADRNRFYNDWIANGKLEGLWYTEVSGLLERNNPFFIADSYPEALDWFIRRNWDQPDKYKIIYWTDGVTSDAGDFLINQDSAGVFLTRQGTAMRTFTEVFSEPLQLYPGGVDAPGVTALYAFKTPTKIVVALEGAASGTTLTLGDLPESEFLVGETLAVDVVDGTTIPLTFTQTVDQVQVDVPSGEDFWYVTLEQLFFADLALSKEAEVVCAEDDEDDDSWLKRRARRHHHGSFLHWSQRPGLRDHASWRQSAKAGAKWRAKRRHDDACRVKYTITVTNNGPDDASNVEVTDQLPIKLKFVSFAASAGTVDSNTGVWGVGSLVNGESATLLISAAIGGDDEDDDECLSVINIAEVTGSDQLDPDSTNDRASASIEVGEECGEDDDDDDDDDDD